MKVRNGHKMQGVLVHVAGSRMIAQGTDGLSRGDQNAGVMTGQNMLDHVPLHLSASVWSPELIPWVFSWATSTTDEDKPVVLSERDWPRAHTRAKTYLWFPPPAAAPAAIEWLAHSRVKRPSSVHVVIIPRLMTGWWFKILNKTTDLVFRIPLGTPVWNLAEHEPLICAICLPFSRNEPWSHKGSERTHRVSRQLQEMWHNDFIRTGFVLRKLLDESRVLREV